MSFLDGLAQPQRSLLEAAARRIVLQPGEFLVHRGDPGGDLFMLHEGTLEVRDRRSIPEVVLATMEPGTLLGEVAFVDGAPRSADVLAVGRAQVLRWHRQDVVRLIEANPSIGSHLYAAIAERAVATIRQLTDTRVGQHVRQADSTDSTDLDGWVDRVSERFKRGIAPLETKLRQSPRDAPLIAQLHHQLDALQSDVHTLFTAIDRDEVAEQAAERLRTDLHPFLARSVLADRSLQRRSGATGTQDVVKLVLTEQADGEGAVGRVLDQWLLDRPTFRALRAMQAPTAAAALAQLPDAPSRSRLLLIGAGTGDLLQRLIAGGEGKATTIVVLDPSATVLDQADVVHVREKLLDFATGRAKPKLAPFDLVLVHGLMEYLPAPLAVSLLERCKHMLVDPSGAVLINGLLASQDDVLLHRLLGWPIIRRSADGVRDLVLAAGLSLSETLPVEVPGSVVLARHPAVANGVGSE